MIRGDILRYRVALALSRAVKVVRGQRQSLTEPQRYVVADYTVDQLKEHGDPPRLSEETKPQSHMPTSR
jgi:hypothetical protein